VGSLASTTAARAAIVVHREALELAVATEVDHPAQITRAARSVVVLAPGAVAQREPVAREGVPVWGVEGLVVAAGGGGDKS
jgi:hypothetical protein